MGISKFIFYKIMGWQIRGNIDRSIKKCVFIVVPHTSWHDFYIGVFIRRILKIQINFIAKKELFKWPFGSYFRWMGGVSLDRTSGQNKVEAIADIFKKNEEFRLALSPEGTRKKVQSWKTGFYYIAMAANVPIICVAFDYGTKTVVLYDPFYPTGDIIADTERLQQKFIGIEGKVKEYSFAPDKRR